MIADHHTPGYRLATLRPLMATFAACVPGFMQALGTLTTEISQSGKLTFELPFFHGVLRHTLNIEFRRVIENPSAFDVSIKAPNNARAFADCNTQELVLTSFTGLPVVIRTVNQPHLHQLLFTIHKGA